TRPRVASDVNEVGRPRRVAPRLIVEPSVDLERRRGTGADVAQGSGTHDRGQRGEAGQGRHGGPSAAVPSFRTVFQLRPVARVPKKSVCRARLVSASASGK